MAKTIAEKAVEMAEANAALTAQVKEQADKITAFEATVSDLTAKVTAAESVTTSLNEKISALTNERNAFADQIKKLEATLSLAPDTKISGGAAPVADSPAPDKVASDEPKDWPAAFAAEGKDYVKAATKYQKLLSDYLELHKNDKKG